LGTQSRSKGSLHSDFLQCSAAELAERGHIAVYPVSGWWKELKQHDRSKDGVRYALVVSLDTKEASADLWSEIDNEVKLKSSIDLVVKT